MDEILSPRQEHSNVEMEKEQNDDSKKSGMKYSSKLPLNQENSIEKLYDKNLASEIVKVNANNSNIAVEQRNSNEKESNSDVEIKSIQWVCPN